MGFLFYIFKNRICNEGILLHHRAVYDGDNLMFSMILYEGIRSTYYLFLLTWVTAVF
jgi:hypothetical protein